MAVLCKGRISFRETRQRPDADEAAFSAVSLFTWVNSMFARSDPRFHAVARSALEAMLYFSPRETMLMDTVLNEWCGADADAWQWARPAACWKLTMARPC